MEASIGSETEGAMNKNEMVPQHPRTHAESVLILANAMFKASIWPVVGVWMASVVLWTVLAGLSGAWSSLAGGAVAAFSALITLWMMRRTVKLDVYMLMAVMLGGFVGKMIVLLVALLALRAIPGVHIHALGVTMLAVVLVNATAEYVAFQRTKLPTLVLTSENTPDVTDQ